MSAGPDSLSADSLDAVVGEIADVAKAFAAADRRLYLVGGVVRDLILGDSAAGFDIDCTTDAPPDQIKELVSPLADALWTQGERFGTIGAIVAGRTVEITTHRAEVYDESSRKPVVSFGTSIEDDLARRDFTINAMAVSLPDNTLIDPHGGKDDLEASLLRTPLEPGVAFTDDPLRMLRAARFIARFGLEPNRELVEAAAGDADRLGIVSVERVHDELERLLALPDPGRGLAFLVETALLGVVLPELTTAGPQAVESSVALAGAPGSGLVRRAGLFYPLGTDCDRAMSRLRYSGEDRAATKRLVTAAEATVVDDPTDATIRRAIRDVGFDARGELEQLVANVRALDRTDQTAHSTTPFGAALAALAAAEDLSDLGSPLSGGQLISMLDLEPGPVVGRAVAHLVERRIDVGPMTDSEALEAVKAWLEMRPGARKR